MYIANHCCLHLKASLPQKCGQVDFSVAEWISEVTRPLDEWLKFRNKTPALSLFMSVNIRRPRLGPLP